VRRTLALRSVQLALGAGALTGLVLAAIPLLGTLGVESALVLGLVMPPFAAVVGVRVVDRARRAGVAVEPGALLASAVAASLAALALAVGIVALNDWRLGACAPLQGLAFEVLGPGFGVVLAAVLGVIVGAVVARPRVATALAIGLHLLAVALGAARFYATPAIYVYSHLVGWFPGTIYDEGVTISGAYLSLRIVTALAIGGLATIFSAAFDPASAGVSLGGLRARPLAALTGAALLALVVLADAHATDLGQASSPAAMEEQLGGRAEGRRCTVIAPRELDQQSLVRLVADCDFRVDNAERWLGVTQRARITAFFFRSADEKRALMGAAETFIAKPWRNEVYLQLEPWPHRVLAHEIAHVVAGNLAPGPFHVAGTLGGWFPDPGLIEGLAVALAWSPRDGLTPHEWALAMQRIDAAPPLRRVLGTSFLLSSGPRSYTVSGSFVRWVWETRGAATVRTLYRSGDVEATLGAPVDELERRWKHDLERHALAPDALALARVRFASGGIFSDVCPHQVALLATRLGGDLAAGDDVRAIHTCHDVLDLDPSQLAARAALAGALARQGRTGQAEHELSELETTLHAPEPIVAAGREGLADALYRRGARARAERIYDALLTRPMAPDDRRVLEVKRLGIAAGAPVDRLLFELLIGRSATPPDGSVAVHIAREIARARPDGLGAYLEARQLWSHERYDLAAPVVARALALGLPTASLGAEARRMQGESLVATGAVDRAAAVWRAALRDPAAREADRVEAQDWLARIRWLERSARRPPPEVAPRDAR